MSLHTLSLLLGVLLILAIVVLAMFAFNQGASIVRQMIDLRYSFKRRRFARIMSDLDKELDKIREEVEPKFELWWSTDGRAIAENAPEMLESVTTGIDVNMLPEEMQEMFKNPALSAIEKNALQFAIHLAGQTAHDAAYTNVQRAEGFEAAEEMRKQRERHLAKHREMLAQIGIDLDAFEELFAAA